MVLYSIFKSIKIYLINALFLDSLFLLSTRLKSLHMYIDTVFKGKNELILSDFVNINMGIEKLRDYPSFLKSEKPSE